MKGEVIRRRQAVIVRRYARKDNGRGGTTTDFDTFTDTTHEIELEIDIDGLFRDLGDKAARSIGGQSRDVGGLVVARRVRIAKAEGRRDADG
jgi:hypothetical protein